MEKVFECNFCLVVVFTVAGKWYKYVVYVYVDDT